MPNQETAELDSRVVSAKPSSRTFNFRAIKADAEKLEVEISFSSEEPVRRYFFETGEEGIEILDHSPGSVRLERIRTAGPVLKFHSRRDWVGKVVEAWIDEKEKKGRAKIRFHQSERAEFEDVASGTKDSISVGYVVHKMVLESKDEVDGPTYRAVDWEPFEISLEPTPADLTVGPGRAIEEDLRGRKTTILSPKSEDKSPEGENKREAEAMPDKPEEITPEKIDKIRSEAAEDARAKELARMQEIQEIADQYGDKVPAVREAAVQAIKEGLSKRQFEAMVAPILDAVPTERFVEETPGANDIGLTPKEAGSFSFARLFAALAFGDKEPAIRKRAEFELAACAEAEAKSRSKVPANGVKIPPDVFRARVAGDWRRGAAIVGAPVATRDLTAGGATTGAPMIQTDVAGGSLIEFLRDMSVLIPRASVFRGLVGNFAIPRVTSGVTGAFVAEGTAPAEAAPTLDQMILSPKSIISYVDVTRRLLLQESIDVEAWLRREIASYFAVTLENAAITDRGSDTNRPQGLLGIAGTVQHNLSGGSFDWDFVVGFETNVDLGAALEGDLVYLTNPKVSGKMKTTIKGGTGSGRFIQENGEANGYPVLRTNQVPSDLGTGSDSGMIFGNAREAAFGFWEDLAFTVDPYSLASSGVVRITGQMEADFNVRRPSSFSVAEDIPA